MSGLEMTVLLGAVVLFATVAAPRLRIAAPLLMVTLGLVLGFIPQLRNVELPPDTVLLLFLPVMLFWESLTTSLRAIKRDFRGIVIMSTLLVVASAFGVALLATALGLPWDAALVLGAALAPPDATAAAALGRTLPGRQFMLLKAESLTNDGTALVVYAIAVGVASGSHYTALDITGLVLLSYFGGIGAGAAVASVAYIVMRRLRDAIAINIALLLTPFAAYLLAEVIGASGVLAAVSSGLVVAAVSGRISTAASRRQTESTWPLGSYLLNGALFVLIGIEAQAVAHDLGLAAVGRLLLVVIAVWIALIVVRFVFPQVSVLIIRVLDRRPSQRARRMSWRARVVSAFAGFRGAVSLAIALSVPTTLSGGGPFPARDDIVFVTAGVILLTLLIQGPLLPILVRWADLPADDAARNEWALAERAITRTVVASLPDLADEHGISEEVRRRLAADYDEHLALVGARHEADGVSTNQEAAELAATVVASGREGARGAAKPPIPDQALKFVPAEDDSPLKRNEEYTRLRLALLDRKREVLLRLRREGTIDDVVARQVRSRLDVEELRLTGIDPIE